MSDAGHSANSPIGDVRLEDILQDFRDTAETEHFDFLSDEDIEAQAASIAELAATYSGETAGIRVHDGRGDDGRLTGTSVLETVTRDMPFLVDSLLGLCAEQAFEVRALFHPIITTSEGVSLSLIQIHVPALSAADAE